MVKKAFDAISGPADDAEGLNCQCARSNMSGVKTAKTLSDASEKKYLAFAEWRIDTHRSTDRGKSIRFFRASRDRTVIWSLVMRGYYLCMPPTISDCMAEVRCSKESVRHIIKLAQSLGYFELRKTPEDARKKFVLPTPRCIDEYQAMVDSYLRLPETMAANGGAKENVQRRH